MDNLLSNVLCIICLVEVEFICEVTTYFDCYCVCLCLCLFFPGGTMMPCTTGKTNEMSLRMAAISSSYSVMDWLLLKRLEFRS